MIKKPNQLKRDFFESERNFRLLVQGITDYAICMLDPAGNVTNWNAGAQRIKGYKARECSASISRYSTCPKTEKQAGLRAP